MLLVYTSTPSDRWMGVILYMTLSEKHGMTRTSLSPLPQHLFIRSVKRRSIFSHKQYVPGGPHLYNPLWVAVVSSPSGYLRTAEGRRSSSCHLELTFHCSFLQKHPEFNEKLP